jgi:ABC-type lipoprotein release transport system permease subunit
MLLKIAWRNIWRSKIRSLVVIMSMVAGVWALIFILSFSNGMMFTYQVNAIRDQWSHIQLHHPGYPEDKDSKFYITDASLVLEKIRTLTVVEAATARVLAHGMVSSARAARGIKIIGADPESEAAVTKFNNKIVEGDYFKSGLHHQILISRRLADKLKVQLRSRIVLTFQGLDSEIVSAAFRVTGLFETGNTILDESMLYVVEDEMRSLMIPGNNGDSESEQDTLKPAVNPDFAQEIAVYLNDPQQLDTVKSIIQSAYPQLLVQDYKELSPDLELYENQLDVSNTIIIVIFMLALIFGIVNTMLMAVLERYRELGMLMAIGMMKGKIFFMILLETLLLGVVATPVGLALGWITVYMLQDTGIDLSSFSKGMEMFGMDTMVYPVLDLKLAVKITIAVFVTTLLAAIYPARKAIRLNPVEALQKI